MKQFIVNVDEAGQIVGKPTEYVAGTEKVTEVTKFIPYHTSTYAWIGVFGLIIIVGLLMSIFTTKQQSVKIIQRLGKFKKLATAGLNFKAPFIDKVAGEMDLRVQQLKVSVNTKTADNVFVDLGVSVQYFVNADQVYDAFYKLEDPTKQIEAYVYDVIRSQVPTLKLDEVFIQKETIAVAIKKELDETMKSFGYSIVKALVIDIDPAANVKESMNEINAATRLQEAATAKGEANKILIIKSAEAEAESKRLAGVGMAGERLAIAEGIKKSVELMKDVTGLPADEIMSTLLTTQYLETMKAMGEEGNATVFLPASPAGVSTLANEIRTAILSTKK